MKRSELTEEQVEHYRCEGYVVLPAFFGSDVLAQLSRRIQQIGDDALAGGDYDKILEVEPETVAGQTVVRRIYNPYDQHDDFKNLANDRRLVDCIESLIGPDINLQHSKLNMKPPSVGSVVEWHQDLAFFPHTNDDLVTVLIYLDDAIRENGCLSVLPRHHTHYFDHATPDGYFAGMITEDLASGRFGEPVALEAPAGSVICMHCITPHSSLPNRSEHPRRTLIFEYRAADSFPIYYPGMSEDNRDVPRPIRGKRAQFARLAGPSPYMRNVGAGGSIYKLQEKAKAALTEATQDR